MAGTVTMIEKILAAEVPALKAQLYHKLYCEHRELDRINALPLGSKFRWLYLTGRAALEWVQSSTF